MEFIYQILPEHVLQAIGWTVLHSLWQAFAVALLLAAYLLAWQKNDARKRYVAGNLALASTLFLAIGTFVYYLRKGQPEPELVSEIVGTDGTVLGRIFTEGEQSAFTDYFAEHMPLIVAFWGIGLVFFVLKMLGSLLYVQHLKTRMTSPLPLHWQERLVELCVELDIRRPVQLLESALAKSPMAIGWLKPVILMPVGAVNCLTPAQVEAILAHELAHVLRNDYLLNLLQSIVEILFYFNPAVWWVSAQVRSERENCCDDIAVRLCGNSLAYAKALVSLQELQLVAPALAMPFSRSKNQLLLRVRRILQPSQNKSNVMEKLSATLLLTLAVVLLSVQANTPFGNFLSNVIAKGESAELEYEAPVPAEMPFAVLADTIPGGTRDAHIHYNSDDEQIEFKMEDDEITFLKVDGEVIPPDRYGEYEAQVRELLAGVPAPPDAPGVPDFPELPGIPAPPPFPEGFDVAAPPMPPMPPSGVRKITTQKDRNGTTFIIETEDGSEPVEIVVKDGKKGTIIVNGQEITGLKKGDKTIIMQDVPGFAPFAWEGAAFSPYDFNFDFSGMKDMAFHAEAFAPLAALEGLQDRYRVHAFSEDFAREWAEKAEEFNNSEEWKQLEERTRELYNSEEMRAHLEEQRALLKEQMEELRQQQQELMEAQREEIQRAIEQSRGAQREALEKELKALEKDREMQRKGKGKM